MYFVIKQLNANVAGETAANIHDNDQTSSNSDDSDSEDQTYRDFLSRTLETSDTDDEDFVSELIGDDIESDTDSQSSVATENLSDDDGIELHRSSKVSKS